MKNISNDEISKRSDAYAETYSPNKERYMLIRSSFRAGMLETLKILNEGKKECVVKKDWKYYMRNIVVWGFATKLWR